MILAAESQAEPFMTADSTALNRPTQRSLPLEGGERQPPLPKGKILE